jgi:hypothetical protein
MRIAKSGNEIHSVEEWFRCAPPKMGKLHWKDGRSAKELAQSWFRLGVPKPPDELSALLESKFGAGIIFDDVKPECIIELDELPGEHRTATSSFSVDQERAKLRSILRQRRTSHSATTRWVFTMTRRPILNRTYLNEFGSYQWHCSGESLMKRFENFGTNFCTRQPPR